MSIKRHKSLLEYAAIFMAILLVCLFILRGNAGAPIWTFIDTETKTPDETAKPAFNKQQLSIDDPASLWFIVNKQRPMPSSYSPTGLRQPNIRVRSSGSNEMLLRDDAATAVQEMVTGAAQQGINLMLVSGYRSYGLQQSVYNSNVALEGRASADNTSARPGHSEHQTGLAADFGTTSGLCQLETCFGKTPEGRWLVGKAHVYGFVVRYPENKQGITGFTYEPWHMRYVGKELAAEVYKSGLTLEQFFGLPDAPTY